MLLLRFILPLMVTAQPYVTPKDSCPKPCPPGAFHNKDGECSEMANLNEACGETRMCEPAYASCVKGLCKCLPGFYDLNSHCYPRSYTCPGQAPLSKAKMCLIDVNECDGPIAGRGVSTGHDGPFFGARCLRPLDVTLVSEESMPKEKLSLGRVKRHTAASMGYKFNGGCGDDEVCTVTSGFQASRCQAFAVGHCCKQTCPVGSPHPQASCRKGSYLPCGRVPGYSCHRGYLTPGAMEAFGDMIDEFFPATCCPTHCPPGTTTTDVGHCYPISGGLDQGCWRDEQCFDRKCIQGICQCEAGTRRVVFPNGLGEACVNATVGPRVGEACTDVCGTEHAKCVAGTCVCGCGYAPVGDRCMRESTGCPGSDGHASCRLWAQTGECGRNPNWMLKNCPIACGLCGNKYG